MEFSTLDKMIEELEKEKNDYVKSMDSRIQQIRNAVEKMKKDYRNETIPQVNGMVEYMIAQGKKRLGKNLVEASDIPNNLLEEFYESMDRKVDTKRIIMSCKLQGVSEYHFFFTDRNVYVWGRNFSGGGCSVYPYKAIRTIKYIEKANGLSGILGCDRPIGQVKELEIKLDKGVQENEIINLRKVFKSIDGTNVMRLLLDLRDYADREQ